MYTISRASMSFDSERIPLTLAFAGRRIGLMILLADAGTDVIGT